MPIPDLIALHRHVEELAAELADSIDPLERTAISQELHAALDELRALSVPGIIPRVETETDRAARVIDALEAGDGDDRFGAEFMADLFSVDRLPRGRDLSSRSFLERNIANADAARHAWGEADPDLAALLAAED